MAEKKASLTVLGGALAGTRFVLEGAGPDMLLGSDPSCAFQLVLGGVSPQHARIRTAADGGITIEDAGSAHGLHVNDSRVDGPVSLRNGDIVWLGTPGEAEVVWTLDSESVSPNLWNDDWDSSPIILDDYMIVGSESSRFWVIKLNRSYDAAGMVAVDPEVVFTEPVWDDEALAANGDDHASVESSVAIYENTAYFGTSAGLIWGYVVWRTRSLRPALIGHWIADALILALMWIYFVQ